MIDRLTEGATNVLPPDGLAVALARGRALRVKFGIDPSGPELTLGHAVVLRRLRRFQELGHTAVLVIGDVTGTVGDPTGRTTGRVAMTHEQTTANARTYLEQAALILSPDRLEVRRNSEWLAAMTVPELLGHAQHVTLAQLLERGDFAARHAANRPIAMSEFLYPVLQGIDSVMVDADVEIGGNDQFFNLAMGRDVQRAAGVAPQVVLTMPLLEGLDGTQKMSKSAGNFVALTDPPDMQFGKLMSIPDPLVGRYAQLCTELDPASVERVTAVAAAGGPAAAAAKREVAAAIVALYHGAAAAQDAESAFDLRFRRREVPADAPTVALPDGEVVDLVRLIVDAGFASSGNAARRLVDDGAVRLDGVAVAAGCHRLPRADLVGRVLAVGRRRLAHLGR